MTAITENSSKPYKKCKTKAVEKTFLSFTKQSQSEIIIWSKNRPLTWYDFKAQFITTSIHGATTCSGINSNWKTKKDSVFLSILAVMDPLCSRVKQDFRTYSSLKHEQLHFDISELYARKLRQTILTQKLVKKDLGIVLKTLVATNDKLLTDYQSKYDTETNHSQIKSKQLEWEKKVAAELKALESYSNAEIRLLLK